MRVVSGKARRGRTENIGFGRLCRGIEQEFWDARNKARRIRRGDERSRMFCRVGRAAGMSLRWTEKTCGLRKRGYFSHI